MYSGIAVATDEGCEATCNQECNELPKGEKLECKQKCFAGRCGNRGMISKARVQGLTGIICEGDTICNEFCEQGPVLDPDCVPEPATEANAPFMAVTIPDSVMAYAFFSLTITVLDEDGQPDPSYQGTIHFETSDTLSGVQVPPDYTFTPLDGGIHVFTNQFRLGTPGVVDIIITEVQAPQRSAVVSLSVVSAPTPGPTMFPIPIR